MKFALMSHVRHEGVIGGIFRSVFVLSDDLSTIPCDPHKSGF